MLRAASVTNTKQQKTKTLRNQNCSNSCNIKINFVVFSSVAFFRVTHFSKISMKKGIPTVVLHVTKSFGLIHWVDPLSTQLCMVHIMTHLLASCVLVNEIVSEGNHNDYPVLHSPQWILVWCCWQTWRTDLTKINSGTVVDTVNLFWTQPQNEDLTNFPVSDLCKLAATVRSTAQNSLRTDSMTNKWTGHILRPSLTLSPPNREDLKFY